MQVSTRSHDFIVDSMSLADQVGPHLRHVFADSSKLKVLHGANQDVHWLRTAFNIEVVNMFDTGQASRVLWPKGHGLKDLLSKYCKVKADKKQQLADWRRRPLSKEMLKYAREDTHYLLYIYDRLRQDLVDKSTKKNKAKLLEKVHQNSNLLSAN